VRLVTALFFLSSSVVLGAFTGCTGILGDFEVTDTSDASTGPSDLGKSCTGSSECSTGFCVDGVCCESACSGTCESCALAEKGKCQPVPDGQDPQKECASPPRRDAGVEIEEAGADASDASDDGAGSKDAGAADAAPDDDGALSGPDGGLQSSDEKCAGSCNGQRACKYPSKETTCGSKYCGSPSVAVRYACNGKGLCELETETCQAFACENDECRKSCASTDDCQPTHFCNPSGVCQERLADGVGCNSPNDCKSGYCVDKVCCNADCTQIAGGTCTKPGNVGKCICSACPKPGGVCKIFYRDKDQDTYGDKFGSVANSGATLGCADDPAPPGFVANNTDCADNDPRAYPGAGYQDSPIVGTSSYDFDCNGTITKETPEFPGASCHFCGPPKLCQDQPLCGTAKQASFLSCAPTTQKCIVNGLPTLCTVCGGIAANDGFTTTVPCGAAGTLTTCGACTVSPGGPTSTTSSKVQRCR
jgi:hypothetical protein